MKDRFQTLENHVLASSLFSSLLRCQFSISIWLAHHFQSQLGVPSAASATAARGRRRPCRRCRCRGGYVEPGGHVDGHGALEVGRQRVLGVEQARGGRERRTGQLNQWKTHKKDRNCMYNNMRAQTAHYYYQLNWSLKPLQGVPAPCGLSFVGTFVTFSAVPVAALLPSLLSGTSNFYVNKT